MKLNPQNHYQGELRGVEYLRQRALLANCTLDKACQLRPGHLILRESLLGYLRAGPMPARQNLDVVQSWFLRCFEKTRKSL